MKFVFILTLLLLWGSSSSLNAQNQNQSGHMPGVQQIITQYGDELNLTDQQKADMITLQIERRSEWQRPGVRGDRQRGQMTGQRRSTGQRGTVRGDRRSDRQGARGTGFERSDIETRWDRSADYRIEILEILTDAQIAQLKSIRMDRIESQYEFRSMRHNAMIERAELDSGKAAEVTSKLNRINELQKRMQIQRMENPDQLDSEALLQVMDEIRTIHEELRSTLTVTEYQKLQPGFRSGVGQRGRQQASGRMFMQRRQ